MWPSRYGLRFLGAIAKTNNQIAKHGMMDIRADAGKERSDSEQAFREPWEAQAFALVVTLHERGLFSWSEWTTTLGEEIKKAQAAGDPDTGETYYYHWLAALERILADKGLADRTTVLRTRKAWRRASKRTPHGTPIVLQPDDFAD
jgi:nitrile hydratase accessory protein